MTRTMYDSTSATDIPLDAPMVAGYINGLWRWSEADWARFPNAVKVRITVNAQVNDGDVLDVETGDALPHESPGWVLMRRAAGKDPSVYVNLSNDGQVKAAFQNTGVPLPHLWLAHYGVPPVVPDGYVAIQYTDQAMIPGQPHYDLSAVADFWPGVETMVIDDNELRAALRRVFSGPDSLEEWVKSDVRVMIEQDPATQAAISALLPLSGSVPPHSHTGTATPSPFGITVK